MVNSDGALTPLEATLNLWRGAAVGGALTILVELHQGQSADELLLESGHGVGSITSSWNWDAQSGIGTLSLQGDSTATALNFRAMLDVLQLRSAVGASEGYRRILVRPDISGSAFRKDFHVREVKVSVNDAPQAPAGGLDDHAVKEDVASDHASATYVVPAFTDKEDDAANKDLTYGAKLVVGGVEQDLPTGHWIEFDKDTQTFTFAPLASHVGSHTLRVRGTDSGGLWVEDDFEVVVSAVNDAPQAPAGGLDDHAVKEDVASDHASATYVVPAFTDKEDDAANKDLTYGAKLVVGGVEQDLPTGHWIEFDKDTQTFTFAPLASHVGSHTLRVRGTDSGGLWVEDDFEVVVSAGNDAPVNDAPEASAVPDRTVNEDATVTYQVLPFTDEDDGRDRYVSGSSVYGRG